eukprot:m.1638271 g.1638271  ORF g.1638271 m.1638271 type:complete len:402 (+) comp27475_c0_seq1:126-1331(+)
MAVKSTVVGIVQEYTCLLIFCVVPASNCYAEFRSELFSYSTGYSGANSTAFNGAFVPSDGALLNSRWRENAGTICGLLAVSPSMSDAEVNTWTNVGLGNNAGAQDLYNLATSYKDRFQAFVEEAARKVPADPSFGPNNTNILKSLESLTAKIESRTSESLPNPVKYIDDSLRGTLIVDTTEKMQSAVNEIKQLAQSSGHLVGFDNKFSPSTQSLAGYVGIHATIYFDKKLLTEVQIHLFNIYDGTLECPKQYSHNIYKVVNTTGSTEAEKDEAADGYKAMKFAFVFGMQRTNPSGARRLFKEARRSTCPTPLSGYAYVVDAGLLIRYNATATSGLYINMEYWRTSDGSWVTIAMAEAGEVLQSGYAISASEANQILSNSGSRLQPSQLLLGIIGVFAYALA